jgi:hypothetical protein
MNTRSLIIGLAVVIVGSVMPAIDLYILWTAPVGSGVRPMAAPLFFLVCGCGTPITVFVLALRGAKQCPPPDRSRGRSALLWTMMALACVLSFVPTFLTVFGYRWIINARQLWVEP